MKIWSGGDHGEQTVRFKVATDELARVVAGALEIRLEHWKLVDIRFRKEPRRASWDTTLEYVPLRRDQTVSRLEDDAKAVTLLRHLAAPLSSPRT